MRVLDLRCTSCGAPLDVPVRSREAACEFCGSHLRIDRQGDRARVEVLDEIARDLHELRRSQEVRDLDHDWERSRDRYTAQTKEGQRVIPTTTGTVIGMTMALAFAIFWTVMASSMGAPGFFVAFGFLFMGAVVFGGLRSLAKARAYARDRYAYRKKRRDLLGSAPSATPSNPGQES